MDEIKLTPELLKQIKKIIDQHAHDKIKPEAYTEFIGYYGKGFMTKGQAQKIQSFYNTYTATPEDTAKKRMYDSVKLKPFVDGNLSHLKHLKDTATDIKKHTGTGSQTGRTVDRMSKPSKASLQPPTPPTNKDIKPSLHEEINRFNQLTNYDTSEGLPSEGLQIKRFRVFYQVGRERVRTTLSLYSASETQAIQKLKQTKPILKHKEVIILSIDPIK